MYIYIKELNDKLFDNKLRKLDNPDEVSCESDINVSSQNTTQGTHIHRP